MTDYIKREDAIKAVANNYWHGTECECYAFAHKALDGIQSADVAPVVRCKDCKWKADTIGDSWCDFHEFTILSDDDYCSYGERKDDEYKMGSRLRTSSL